MSTIEITIASPEDSEGSPRYIYAIADSPDDPVTLWRSKFIENGERKTLTELRPGVQDSAPVRNWMGSKRELGVFIPSTVQALRDGRAFDFTISGLVIAEDSQLSVIKRNSFCEVSLRSIFIPESVEVIEEECFRRCRGLREVLFAEPSRLKDIKEYAFRRCPLKSIAIPASVEHLGRGCFSHSEIGVATFAQGSHLQEIPSWLFADLDGPWVRLRSITIPASVEVVGYGSFRKCRELNVVIFDEPAKVRKLEGIAFSRCDGLRSIRLPASIEEIERSCFSRCSGLTSVIFAEPAKVQSLGESAFSACIAMTSIRLPASIEVIGSYCFSGCRRLHSVSVAEESHLKTVGTDAFAGSDVTDVSFPNGVHLQCSAN